MEDVLGRCSGRNDFIGAVRYYKEAGAILRNIFILGGNKMEISDKTTGNTAIISLNGRLDSYSANDIEGKLNSMIDAGQVRVVINLEQLEYISSSGLRVFLASLKKVRKLEGDIRLACLKPYVKEVFDIAGFTQLFNIFDAENAALDSFAGA